MYILIFSNSWQAKSMDCYPNKDLIKMYNKGDKIVYPMYGAGIIEDLEDRVVDGNNTTYYILKIPTGNLTIMISACKAEDLGIRQVYDREMVFRAIEDASDEPVAMSENWNQRYKDNMLKIKTGKLVEVAVVYRDLLRRERLRGISSAEKKVLTTAKQIIISELIISCGIEKNEAEKILEDSADKFFFKES